MLIGTHFRRLERDLSSAGHNVEIASRASSAKRKDYAVVVADDSNVEEARASFGENVVIGTGDNAADRTTIEARVARKPSDTRVARVPVAVRVRDPIETGPPQDKREVVAAKEGTAPRLTETPPVPEPKPEPKPVAERPKAVTTEPKPVVETPKPEPRPVRVAVVAKPSTEMYFGLSASKVGGGMTASLNKAAKWLTSNPDISVVIEGHADPSGDHASNMTLSQARADSVREFLVSAGVDASRLDVQAFGDTKLKYGASDGRNRRVLLVPKK